MVGRMTSRHDFDIFLQKLRHSQSIAQYQYELEKKNRLDNIRCILWAIISGTVYSFVIIHLCFFMSGYHQSISLLW